MSKVTTHELLDNSITLKGKVINSTEKIDTGFIDLKVKIAAKQLDGKRDHLAGILKEPVIIKITPNQTELNTDPQADANPNQTELINDGK